MWMSGLADISRYISILDILARAEMNKGKSLLYQYFVLRVCLNSVLHDPGMQNV